VQKPLNRPPDARDDGTDVVNGGSTTVSVLLNDSDPDGDALSVSIVSSADGALGSTSLDPNRSISFTATPGAQGTAVITYQVSDGELTDNAVLRINVRPCSESSPVANDGFLRTGYRQPIAVDLNSYGSSGNIVDIAGPGGYVNGTYTPPDGENGNIAITYSVVNSCRLRANGRITIDVNQEPVAQPKSVNVFRGEPVTIPVTDLATDAEALTISAINGAPGWVQRQGDRLVINPPIGTPAGGVPAFNATVTDPGGLTTAVTVSVAIQNRSPVANAITIDVTDGNPKSVSLAADSDGDSPGGLTIGELSTSTLNFSGGGSGTVALSGDRSVAVSPAGNARGTATFTYRVRDSDGGVSEPATVTVQARSVNQPPAVSDQEFEVTVGTTRVIDLEAIDNDGPDPLTVIEFSDPGGVVTSPPGLRLSVLASAPGTFTVTYRVTDGEATSRTVTLTITAPAPATTTTTTTTTSTSTTTTTTTTPP